MMSLKWWYSDYHLPGTRKRFKGLEHHTDSKVWKRFENNLLIKKEEVRNTLMKTIFQDKGVPGSRLRRGRGCSETKAAKVLTNNLIFAVFLNLMFSNWKFAICWWFEDVLRQRWPRLTTNFTFVWFYSLIVRFFLLSRPQGSSTSAARGPRQGRRVSGLANS